MIHWKKKDFSRPPLKLTTTGCYKQIAKAVLYKDGGKYTTTYYQDDEVLNTLRAYSINKDIFDPSSDEPKCFYCESFTETVATLQVEHYRPKSKTCDENNNEIHGTNGYYWLGCEWSNLLLACPHCNGSSAKWNKFPIKGKRVYDGNPIGGTNSNPIYNRTDCFANADPLQKEKPLLLNPEVDEIMDKFKFSKEGVIKGIGAKGKMSVEIYKLDRSQLNIARKKIKDALISSINKEITKCERGIVKAARIVDAFELCCEEILSCNHPSKEYTLWARYFNENFEEHFVSEVPDKYKQQLRSAYERARQNQVI